MKDIVLAIVSIGLLAYAGGVLANGVPQHSAEVNEIISIHTQMTELDRLILKDPRDLSLGHAMEKLESELISRMREYNSEVEFVGVKKKQALEAVPAAGPHQEK